MKKQKKYNKGIITLPFLLVLIIILFFTLSFLMLSMTLAHVTVTQYLTYSSARKLALAGETEDKQLESAIHHYKKLRGQFFKPTAHREQGDWFDIQAELDDESQQTDSANKREYLTPKNPYRTKPFYGINAGFLPLAFNFKIPFLIEDKKEIKQEIRVSSFLGREPSKEDCKKFYEQKGSEIVQLCNQTDCPDIKEPENLIGDNGC